MYAKTRALLGKLFVLGILSASASLQATAYNDSSPPPFGNNSSSYLLQAGDTYTTANGTHQIEMHLGATFFSTATTFEPYLITSTPNPSGYGSTLTATPLSPIVGLDTSPLDCNIYIQNSIGAGTDGFSIDFSNLSGNLPQVNMSLVTAQVAGIIHMGGLSNSQNHIDCLSGCTLGGIVSNNGMCTLNMLGNNTTSVSGPVTGLTGFTANLAGGLTLQGTTSNCVAVPIDVGTITHSGTWSPRAGQALITTGSNYSLTPIINNSGAMNGTGTLIDISGLAANPPPVTVNNSGSIQGLVNLSGNSSSVFNAQSGSSVNSLSMPTASNNSGGSLKVLGNSTCTGTLTHISAITVSSGVSWTLSHTADLSSTGGSFTINGASLIIDGAAVNPTQMTANTSSSLIFPMNASNTYPINQAWPLVGAIQIANGTLVITGSGSLSGPIDGVLSNQASLNIANTYVTKGAIGHLQALKTVAIASTGNLSVSTTDSLAAHQITLDGGAQLNNLGVISNPAGTSLQALLTNSNPIILSNSGTLGNTGFTSLDFASNVILFPNITFTNSGTIKGLVDFGATPNSQFIQNGGSFVGLKGTQNKGQAFIVAQSYTLGSPTTLNNIDQIIVQANQTLNLQQDLTSVLSTRLGSNALLQVGNHRLSGTVDGSATNYGNISVNGSFSSEAVIGGLMPLNVLSLENGAVLSLPFNAHAAQLTFNGGSLLNNQAILYLNKPLALDSVLSNGSTGQIVINNTGTFGTLGGVALDFTAQTTATPSLQLTNTGTIQGAVLLGHGANSQIQSSGSFLGSLNLGTGLNNSFTYLGGSQIALVGTAGQNQSFTVAQNFSTQNPLTGIDLITVLANNTLSLNHFVTSPQTSLNVNAQLIINATGGLSSSLYCTNNNTVSVSGQLRLTGDLDNLKLLSLNGSSQFFSQGHSLINTTVALTGGMIMDPLSLSQSTLNWQSGALVADLDGHGSSNLNISGTVAQSAALQNLNQVIITQGVTFTNAGYLLSQFCQISPGSHLVMQAGGLIQSPVLLQAGTPGVQAILDINSAASLQGAVTVQDYGLVNLNPGGELIGSLALNGQLNLKGGSLFGSVTAGALAEIIISSDTNLSGSLNSVPNLSIRAPNGPVTVTTNSQLTGSYLNLGPQTTLNLGPGSLVRFNQMSANGATLSSQTGTLIDSPLNLLSSQVTLNGSTLNQNVTATASTLILADASISQALVLDESQLSAHNTAFNGSLVLNSASQATLSYASVQQLAGDGTGVLNISGPVTFSSSISQLQNLNLIAPNGQAIDYYLDQGVIGTNTIIGPGTTLHLGTTGYFDSASPVHVQGTLSLEGGLLEAPLTASSSAKVLINHDFVLSQSLDMAQVQVQNASQLQLNSGAALQGPVTVLSGSRLIWNGGQCSGPIMSDALATITIQAPLTVYNAWSGGQINANQSMVLQAPIVNAQSFLMNNATLTLGSGGSLSLASPNASVVLSGSSSVQFNGGAIQNPLQAPSVFINASTLVANAWTLNQLQVGAPNANNNAISLTLNQSLNSQTINNYGHFMVNASVNAASFNNYGTVQLNQTQTLTGHYLGQSGSSLNFVIEADGSCGSLVIAGGSFTVPIDASISLSMAAESIVPQSATYTLLQLVHSSTDLQTLPLTVNLNLAADFSLPPAYTVNTHIETSSLQVTIAHPGYSQLNQNSQTDSLATTLDAIRLSSDIVTFTPLLQAIDLSPAASLNQALQTLAPASHGGVLQATRNRQSILDNRINQRIDRWRDVYAGLTNYNAGDDFADFELEQADSALIPLFFINRLTDTQTNGFTSQGFGFGLLREGRLSRNWWLGAGLNLGRTQVKSSSDTTQIQSYSALFYSNYQMGSLGFDLSVNLARNQLHGRRLVTVLGSVADARYASSQYGMNARLSYHWHRADWSIAPQLILNLSDNRQAAYSEQGAGLANLTVAPINQLNTQTGPGLHVMKEFACIYGKQKLGLDIHYLYNLKRQAPVWVAAFAAGSPNFQVSGEPSAQTALSASARWQWLWRDNVDLGFNVTLVRQGSLSGQQLDAKLRWRF